MFEFIPKQTPEKMRKNLYYKTVIQRMEETGKSSVYALIYVSGFARTLFQVFIRKNFGERYFSIWSTLHVTVVLMALRILPELVRQSRNPFTATPIEEKSSGGGFVTWYLFIIAFWVFSIWREFEIKRSRSSFDLEKYSLYSGDYLKFFNNLIGRTYFGLTITKRQMEIFIEPAGFFILGALLYFPFGEYLGLLLMVCAFFYMCGYAAMYNLGDNFVLDLIDNNIAGRQNADNFSELRSPNKVDSFLGTPQDRETADKLSKLMIREEPVFLAE